MKTRYYLKTIKLTMLFLCMVTGTVFFTDCTKDEDKGEAYFTIEGDPTSLTVTTAGITQKYVVRSNRHWEVVAQDDSSDWVKPFPAEGDDDGIFKFTVKANSTPYNRTAYFAFVVDGEEQPVLFTVQQEASAPYLVFTDTLGNDTSNWVIAGRANKLRINISSNVDYTYTIADSWLTVVADSSNKCLILEAPDNLDDVNARSTTISFVSNDFQGLNQTLTIKQESFSPAITVSDINSLNELDFEPAGSEITLAVDCNVDWNYVLASNDWLTVSKATNSSVTLKASANTTGVQRSLAIKFGFDDYNGGKEVTVIQYAGVDLVTENFDWVKSITSGTNSAGSDANVFCYNTGPRYDTWKAAGIDTSSLSWTTTLLSDGTTSLYAQNGYIKLGKTTTGADIIFRKIVAIQGTVKLKVSLKATAYVTAAGNQNDVRLLQIFALNAGIPSVSNFDIVNYPEKGTQTDAAAYNVIWDDNRAFSFTISQATSQTRLRFLAGTAVGTMSTTNRISLDEIVISY